MRRLDKGVLDMTIAGIADAQRPAQQDAHHRSRCSAARWPCWPSCCCAPCSGPGTCGAEFAAKDRLATRHKVTFVMPLPKRYVDDRRAGAGRQAGHVRQLVRRQGSRTTRTSSSPHIAVDPRRFLDVYDEVVVTPEAEAAWLADRQGAIVGDVLAQASSGLKVGDKVTLHGTIYPGDWEFNIDGIYDGHRASRSIARSFFFHWDVPERTRPRAAPRSGRLDRQPRRRSRAARPTSPRRSTRSSTSRTCRR